MKINDRELVFVASADGPPVDKEGILMKRCVCGKFLMRTTLFECGSGKLPKKHPKLVKPLGLEAAAAD
jgi:hypothetical protein